MQMNEKAHGNQANRMETSNEMPLVSVCIPVYNHERYVGETIQSVIDQDYENIELIIIDDGSADASSAVVEKMMEACASRFASFKFIKRSNRGLSHTLNEGFDWCKGKYFSPIASDDVMLPGKTSTLVSYLEAHPKCGAVFGQIKSIDSMGIEKTAPYYEPRTLAFEMLFRNLGGPPAPAQLVRRDVIFQVGKYRADMLIEDLYMWLAISSAGYEITVIDSPVVKYRDHQGNTTKNAEVMLQGRLQIIDLYKKSEKFNKVRAEAYLMAAHEAFLSSRKKSLSFFYEAFKHDAKIVLQQSAQIYLCRALIPQALYKKISLYLRARK